MCGIAGLLGFGFSDRHLQEMLDAMRHRGPDGEGVWNDPVAGVRLGHVRLAVIDVATGDQPMLSPDGRHVLIFNGEIYNYLELKRDLEARNWVFRTTSDTEVLLAGLILDGPQFLDKTIGMFALALWDRDERSMLLARDRMGIKPLYVAETPGGFAFASELKSLLELPGVSRDLDLAALDAYLTLRYVPTPHTLIRDIRKFPAAHYLILRGEQRTMVRWWSLRFESGPGVISQEAEERLDWLLDDAVRLCLRSDVPVGSFLSGGIDSGLVTALMARHSSAGVRSFSIGFQSGLDERSESRATAKAIGTQHTELELLPADLQRLPQVVAALDEPFPDPIVLAMSLLAEKSRSDVKVILTGEGADELFAGYVHHPHMRSLDRFASWMPPGAPGLAAAAVACLPVSVANRFFSYSARLAKRDVSRLSEVMREVRNPAGRYLAYVSLFNSSDRQAIYRKHKCADESAVDLVSRCIEHGAGGYMDRVWSCEYRYWLSDNILFKQDKTLMSFGVEGRVPFCDHRLVEFAAALPMSARLASGGNKIALRQAALRMAPGLPRSPAKKAFMVPMDGQYGKAIRELAGDVLSSACFRKMELFDETMIDQMLSGFPSPSILEGKQILSLLMLALWNQEVRVKDTGCH